MLGLAVTMLVAVEGLPGAIPAASRPSTRERARSFTRSHRKLAEGSAGLFARVPDEYVGLPSLSLFPALSAMNEVTCLMNGLKCSMNELTCSMNGLTCLMFELTCALNEMTCPLHGLKP